MVTYAPPVGPNSRHLLPGSDYAAAGTGPNDPVRRGPHAGLDFQPVARGNADPVDWLVGGTITRIVRNRVQGSGADSLYRHHTGNAVEWAGDDGRLWHYRHMPQWAMKDLRVGQRVEAGRLATHMGTTGNSNGVHVHIGCRVDGRFVDPEPILRNAGVWPIGYTAKPAPERITPASVDPSKHVRSELSIRQICIKAGHGDEKTSTGLLIERYQHRQLAPYQLVHDRQWGTRTDAHYQWTLALQRAMNAWKGNKVAEDGDYRRVTKERVLDLQRRNLKGAYWRAGGRVADGIPGPIFCKMLGIRPHP
ncbi:peptidoglycan DD-metalloendopeptidase family protein [Micrococcus sp. IITD107]|uniref:peptidoglycan DD-metalloendopeptidase family protein n=1 Tax=Micrococcus sp. IITD107 TaxID=3342790 RepID=UPI0035B92B66